jgi:hypothetical protein
MPFVVATGLALLSIGNFVLGLTGGLPERELRKAKELIKGRLQLRMEDTRAVTVPTYCAVHNEQYMYVDYSTGEEELYDLQADPYELQNQASNPDPPYPAVKAAMHARLLQLCSPPPPGFTP